MPTRRGAVTEPYRIGIWGGAARGGTWTHSLRLAAALDRSQFEVELITRPLDHDEGMRSQARASGLSHVEVADHEQLAAHLLERRLHVLHHFDSLLVLMGFELAADELGPARPASVQLLHANGRPTLPLELADVIVGVSASTLEWPGASLELGGRARVIDSGVPLTSAGARAWREPVELLCVSRLVDESKGLEQSLAALATLRDRSWRYRIAGDGPARAALLAQAESLGIASRIEWLGGQVALDPIYAEAEVLLSASPSEGFGLAIAEAAEAGLALVVRRAGGFTRALTHERDALIYEHPDQLPPLLARVLDDASLRARLGASARALVHARFGHAAMVERYAALYRELIAAGC